MSFDAAYKIVISLLTGATLALVYSSTVLHARIGVLHGKITACEQILPRDIQCDLVAEEIKP